MANSDKPGVLRALRIFFYLFFNHFAPLVDFLTGETCWPPIILLEFLRGDLSTPHLHLFGTCGVFSYAEKHKQRFEDGINFNQLLLK